MSLPRLQPNSIQHMLCIVELLWAVFLPIWYITISYNTTSQHHCKYFVHYYKHKQESSRSFGTMGNHQYWWKFCQNSSILLGCTIITTNIAFWQVTGSRRVQYQSLFEQDSQHCQCQGLTLYFPWKAPTYKCNLPPKTIPSKYGIPFNPLGKHMEQYGQIWDFEHDAWKYHLVLPSYEKHLSSDCQQPQFACGQWNFFPFNLEYHAVQWM